MQELFHGPTPETWDKVAEDYCIELTEFDKEMAEDIFQILKKNGILPGASICELGSGSGHLSAVLAQKGYKVSLVDFSEVALQKAKETFALYNLEGSFYYDDIFTFTTEEKFDLIWNSGVLEHFSTVEFKKLLGQLRQLVQEGRFLFIVPNYRSRAYLLWRYNKHSTNDWPYGREYIWRDYAVLAEQAGYQVKTVEYISRMMPIGHFESVFNDSKNVSSYREMMENGFLPDDEAYLTAFIMESKADSAAKVGVVSASVEDSDYSKEHIMELSAELFGTKRKNNALEAQCFKLSSENQEMAKYVETLKAEISHTTQDMNDLTCQNAELKKSLDNMEAAIEEVKLRCSELKNDNTQLKNDNTQLKNDNTQLMSRLSEQLQIVETNKEDIEYMRTSIYNYQIIDTKMHHSLFGLLFLFSVKVRNRLSKIGFVSAIRNKCIKRYLWNGLKKIGIGSAIKKSLPKGVQSKLKAQLESEDFAIPVQQIDSIKRQIDNFVANIREDEHVWLIVSGVEYIDSEGQRNIRIVNEAMKKGIKVIYSYFRWNHQDSVPEPQDKIVFVPLDYLYANKASFFERYLTNHPSKAVIVEFPHAYADHIVQIANCFHWITIYDVIDDWEEFSKHGQAIWYQREIEDHMLYTVDINVATAKKLRQKMMDRVPNLKEYHVISNGVDTERIKATPRTPEYNFSRGNLQIGYFGHLAEAWFDWDMIRELCERHSDWTFHIIGYGQPEKLVVPSNCILYGKKKPDELAYYAAYWDVAIIPFINCELTLGINPIKIYEYLRFMLPVVASNMPEIVDAPYTQLAIGTDAFEHAIIEASKMKLDQQVVDEYVLANTWQKKCEAFMDTIDNFNKKDSIVKQLI